MQNNSNAFLYLRGPRTCFGWVRLRSQSEVARVLGCHPTYISSLAREAMEEGRGGFYVRGHKVEFEQGREHRAHAVEDGRIFFANLLSQPIYI